MIRKRDDVHSPKTPKTTNSKRQRFQSHLQESPASTKAISSPLESPTECEEHTCTNDEDSIEYTINNGQVRLHFILSNNASPSITKNNNLPSFSLLSSILQSKADFIVAIFQFLEPDFLLQTCSLVCTHWYRLSHSLLVSGSADLYKRTHVATPDDAALRKASKILETRIYGCKQDKQSQHHSSPGFSEYAKHTVEVEHLCVQHAPWQIQPVSPSSLASPSSLFASVSASWPSVSPLPSPLSPNAAERTNCEENVNFDLSAVQDAWSASLTEQNERSIEQLVSVELESTKSVTIENEQASWDLHPLFFNIRNANIERDNISKIESFENYEHSFANFASESAAAYHFNDQ